MNFDGKTDVELMIEDSDESIAELRRRLEIKFGNLSKKELTSKVKKIGDIENIDVNDDDSAWMMIYYLTKYHGDKWRL